MTWGWLTLAGLEPVATPAGRVATSAHIGPNDRLGDARASIRELCKANGHALAGPRCEIYGHWTEEVGTLRTYVYYLLKP